MELKRDACDLEESIWGRIIETEMFRNSSVTKRNTGKSGSFNAYCDDASEKRIHCVYSMTFWIIETYLLELDFALVKSRM